MTYDLNASRVTPPPLPSAAPPAPLDMMEVATLDELRRLQDKKANWRFSVVLLFLSALAFIYFSRTTDYGQSWEYVGIIVGILLFHEMGHYVAMKIFGYRNLRMFFIPGFGAAVSGRHYNAPAWKKIIVSLMGPLPGIVAGIVLLVLSQLLHNALLFRICVFAIVINAFNLIPVLPFDGGWVAHAALFSRHPKLDVGFRLAAAGMLVALGLTLPGMRILTFLAIVSLIAVPLAYKLAVIVSELRQIPGMGVSPDSQTIPPETARLILARVRQKFTRNLNAKIAAQHVVSVFESLNTRPPSVGATIGLLSLHAAGFGLALLVGGAALVVDYRSRNHTFAMQGSYALAPDGLESSGPPPAGDRHILVAQFKTQLAAPRAFDALSAQQSAGRFGHTLLVSFTPAQADDQRDLFERY
jgi:Zn-dependent protease